MRHLKLIGSAIVAASLTAGIGAAPAADMKVRYAKNPVMAVAEPGSDWSGFYIGANVGYGITRSPTDNYFMNPGNPPTVNVGSSTPISASGVIGGGQIGYNWMGSSGVVIGLETDFQGAGQKGRSFVDLTGFYGPGAFMAVESKLTWFGTVRGRIGWAANPATLLYATGGFAYGQVEVANSSIIGLVPSGASVRETKTGYTVGGGIETRLWNNWTAKAEYLYVDLGATALANLNNNGQTHNSSVSFRDNIFRLGLNYRMDWGRPVIAARY